MHEVTKEELQTFVNENARTLYKRPEYFHMPTRMEYRYANTEEIVAYVVWHEEMPKDGIWPFRWEPNKYFVKGVK